MGKMTIKEKEPETPTQAEAPVLIFSEDEVQKVADFVNFMWANAEFKAAMPTYEKVKRMFHDMHGHVSKIEGYILEHRRTVKAK